MICTTHRRMIKLRYRCTMLKHPVHSLVPLSLYGHTSRKFTIKFPEFSCNLRDLSKHPVNYGKFMGNLRDACPCNTRGQSYTGLICILHRTFLYMFLIFFTSTLRCGFSKGPKGMDTLWWFKCPLGEISSGGEIIV